MGIDMFYVFYFMIYKSLTRLYLDNGNVIYDAFFSSSFHEEHDSIQYSAAWALRSAIRGTFNKKVYEKKRIGISSTKAVVHEIMLVLTIKGLFAFIT